MNRESMYESAIIGFCEMMNATTETDAAEFDKREPVQSDSAFLPATAVA